MTTTLIDNYNSNIKKIKATQISFLSQEERAKINKIIYELKILADYSEQNDKEKVLQGSKNLRAEEIVEIFANIKSRVSKEEQKEAEVLEENILQEIERLVLGINYWENIEELQKEAQRQLLEEYIKDNLLKHAEFNDRVQKRMEAKQENSEEEQEEIDDIYWGIDEPQELLEKIEDDKLNEVVIKIIEKGEQDANIHIKAIRVGEKMNKKIAEDLREEVEENLGLLKSEREKNEKLTEEKKNLQKELKEQKELLKKAKDNLEKEKKEKEDLKKEVVEEKNKTEKWEKKFHLATKSLPKMPNKIKILKEKTKTKSRHLIEKIKQQSQELIAKIEVKVK